MSVNHLYCRCVAAALMVGLKGVVMDEEGTRDAERAKGEVRGGWNWERNRRRIA